jgi:hypothetical protein
MVPMPEVGDAAGFIDRLRFPALWPGTTHWWRRGDSTSTAFAAGWTMPSSERPGERADAERVIQLIESAGS